MNQVIIIGSGPAGLLAAISAGRNALILERNPYAGRKLLLSGSGQCNFSNKLSVDDFLKASGAAANFLKPALYEFDNHAFIKLLTDAGCPCIFRKDGKAFPKSLRSADLRDALLKLAYEKGAKISYDTKVESVKKNRDGTFILTTDKGKDFSCEKLILATGGMSYPETGSDGIGYKLAKSLGHKLIPTHSALAGVELKAAEHFKECAGIAIPNARVGFCGKKGRLCAQGDLLFTHKGLSGPVILDHSHLLSAGSKMAVMLVDDPGTKLLQLVKDHPKKHLESALKYLDLPQNLIGGILKHLELDPAILMAELKTEDRNMLSNYLGTAMVTIKAVEGFDKAMATSGGIPLRDVSPRTMQSRICPDLYFAGEMLDYDLPSGGFNIQAAASTGWLAGKQAAAGSSGNDNEPGFVD